MKRKKFKDWLEIIGIIAVVASLIFVGYEIRQSQDIAVSGQLDSTLEAMAEVEALIIDNADVWHRGCSGEDLSNAEQLIFTRIFNLYTIQYFFRWLNIEVTGISPARKKLTIDNMAINLHRSVGLKREWEALERWRDYMDVENDFKEWRRLVNIRVKELATIEPVPQINISRCGLL